MDFFFVFHLSYTFSRDEKIAHFSLTIDHFGIENGGFLWGQGGGMINSESNWYVVLLIGCHRT